MTTAVLVASLAACGGGGGSNDAGSGAAANTAAAAASATADSSATTASGNAAAGNTANASASTASVASSSVTPEMPASREAAARFLTQATFGPIDSDIDAVMALGYGAWIDAQFATAGQSHRADWEAADAALKAVDPTTSAGQNDVFYSFWKQSLRGPDQLRQRVAYALSEIMVISMIDSNVGANPRGAAAYLDMLGDKGLGNYRDLIEGVAMHPLMGLYLSSMHNQKADPKTGRVPDENFAREVMQLFSIGLHQLNLDGSEKVDASGQSIDTYAAADVAGMAKVFTGWSWACPTTDYYCFFNGKTSDGSMESRRDYLPMQAYPAFHATETKSFLGTTLAAQPAADPKADLKAALDVLFNHPNVGPFIGRQLIQRLVTSNPSPAYVAAVAGTFNNNGAGVRGDMRAVVKAILMNPEARVSSSTQGKLREPVLRWTAYLRAFSFTSDSGHYLIGATDDAGSQLGQTPLRSSSVFNFYRPGYVPPGTQAAAHGLQAPEFQIASETSAAGYVNATRDVVASGIGTYSATLKRRDLQGNYSAELALATQTSDLVDRLNARLMYGSMPAALKTEIQGTIDKVVIPALNKAGTNQAAIDTAKRNRVNTALLLTLVSPEFQVQK